jgi:CRISPR-associated exonuclease Cas4
MDRLQLAAQALCLEEMLCCTVKSAYLYYGETRRRVEVPITCEIRDKVRSVFAEMHHYYDRRYTPKVKPSKQCKACSLKNICLPVLCKNKRAGVFIYQMLKEEVDEKAT